MLLIPTDTELLLSAPPLLLSSGSRIQSGGSLLSNVPDTDAATLSGLNYILPLLGVAVNSVMFVCLTDSYLTVHCLLDNSRYCLVVVALFRVNESHYTYTYTPCQRLSTIFSLYRIYLCLLYQSSLYIVPVSALSLHSLWLPIPYYSITLYTVLSMYSPPRYPLSLSLWFPLSIPYVSYPILTLSYP